MSKINLFFTIEPIEAIFNELKNTYVPTYKFDLLEGVKEALNSIGGIIEEHKAGNPYIVNGFNIITNSNIVLCYINNLLYAFKKGNDIGDEIKSKISKIVPGKYWINPNNFSAYEVKKGKHKSIFSRKTGLIKETWLDKIGEKMIEDFRQIALATMCNTKNKIAVCPFCKKSECGH